MYLYEYIERIQEAEKTHDLKAVWLYFDEAERQITDIHMRWILQVCKASYKIKYDKDAYWGIVTQELLGLREQARADLEKDGIPVPKICRIHKDLYAWLLLKVLERNYLKKTSLPEYEELCLELLDLMEERHWEMIPNERKEGRDDYSLIHYLAGSYYMETGKVSLAQHYFEKVWQKYKEESYITSWCVVALEGYERSLVIGGDGDKCIEVNRFLIQHILEGRAKDCDEQEMEPILQSVLCTTLDYMEGTGHPEWTAVLKDALDGKLSITKKPKKMLLHLYFTYLFWLNQEGRKCSLKKQLEIKRFLKKIEQGTDLSTWPDWKKLRYSFTCYYLYKMKKSRKATGYLERGMQLLQNGRFDGQNRLPFLQGSGLVALEYKLLGQDAQAVACARNFMQKNIEFYSSSEFYADNSKMEQYLENCTLAFQFIYQAVQELVPPEEKFTYSMNYKKTLSSVLRLRNQMHAADEREFWEREKNPHELKYYPLEWLKKALPEDTAILDFLYIEPEIFPSFKRVYVHPGRAYQLEIFILVKRQGECQIRYKSIPDAKGLNGQLDAFSEQIKPGHGNGKFNKLLPRIYRELFSDLEPLWEGIRHLWVCPDGPLCNFPFEALFWEAGQASPEDFTYWQSLRDIFEVWEGGGAKAACIIGDPQFALGDTGHGEPKDAHQRWACAQLKPLPYSGYEAVKLSRLVGGQCYIHEKATKFVLKPGYRYVHIATHGFSQGEGNDSWRNSSLAFSGAQDYLREGKSIEGYGNGFLSAEEISKMDFAGTEVVALSACGSGKSTFSKYQQQAGIHVAFGIAGAKYIISALWEVDDFPTAVLMVFLYQNLKQGLPAPTALAQAKIQLREATAESLARLILEDEDILPDTCRKLLSFFREMPDGYCCYSSIEYWGSFICSQAMW